MTAFPIKTEHCDEHAFLAGDQPLASAVELLAHHGRAVWPIALGTRTGAALAIDLRAGAQQTPERAIGTLTDPALVHRDETEARRFLTADPHRHGAVVASANASVTLTVERVAPRIRTAIVMAGGLGSRLRPLTDDTPKPLLPIAGRELLFRIIDRLALHGVERVLVSINHLGAQIRNALGDGNELGVQVEYLEELEPLDTGAGLALIDRVTEPFFVVNGDILTALDFSAFGRWHQVEGAVATIVTHRYTAPLPYGVVRRAGARVAGIEEKPAYRYDINAGIYAFAPEALGRVVRGKRLAMVDFLNRLCGEGASVRAFPIVEYWNDIGTPGDYERAQRDAAKL